MIAEWANDKNGSASHACSECELGIQHIRLSSPFVFSALTSSCGVQGYTYDIPAQYALNWTGPFPDRSCDHTEITAQPNDTCINLSGSHSVSTFHLIQKNAMDFACNDLPRRSHYLCLPLHCKTHQLGSVEDCNSLVEDFNITMKELLKWSPMINSNCTNLDSWRGWHLCTSSPTSTIPYREDGSLKRPERKLPTPPTPNPLAPGTIEGCYRYENANEEESARDASLNVCWWWAAKGEVKVEELLAWNPSLRWGEGCYLKPGYRSGYNRQKYATKIKGQRFSREIESANSSIEYLSCSKIPDYTGLSLSELRTLNPWIEKNCKEDTFTSKLSEDGFLQLCLERSNPDLTPLSLPNSIQPAATTICKEWHIVSEGDTCQSVIEKYGISPDEFSSWNPGIRNDCSTLWVGYGVCIGVKM
ncbi:hypothetical protein TRV_02199 [Trichophyton verrucosum HKI 0517]|uniref:LysM domain-containing protein n=1 Tax=Trichophyton verrucosum (strain HKI 0517) TaxID=663202 RepID=D4D529_TRIVH|nr:uncharacterized protein TRV_02199 [Trichophyton verrucosum HKI 0517]EFE43072.1 hypothetical protein TRV_02199 [Trichophyton verrucosum HKI 0517]